MGGVCRCWVSVLEEESKSGSGEGQVLWKLKKEMKGVVYLLKVAIEEPVFAVDEPGVVEAKGCFKDEVRALVDADEELKELLLGKIDVDDSVYFGVYS